MHRVSGVPGGSPGGDFRFQWSVGMILGILLVVSVNSVIKSNSDLVAVNNNLATSQNTFDLGLVAPKDERPLPPQLEDQNPETVDRIKRNVQETDNSIPYSKPEETKREENPPDEERPKEEKTDEQEERIARDRDEKKEDEPKPKKPLNIIFLYGDDWRHDSIGSAGTQIVLTPFLDKLAEEGIRFTHNCVTTSVCWISRATLYTGQYVSRHKSTYPQDANWYKGWDKTIPYLLREHGYHTGHVGKWHFEWNELVWKTFDFSEPYYGDHWYEMERGRIHTTRRSELDSIRFLKNRPKDKPFALFVCFFAPHAVDHEQEQYFPQARSMRLYVNDTVQLPPSGSKRAWKKMPPFFTPENEARRRWFLRFGEENGHLNHTKRQKMMKNYFRLITEIDESSHRIIRFLKSHGGLNDTLIIFTTDNGLFHAEHGLAGKWYPHQESIRVPLIIKDPRMPKEKIGTLNDDFTLNIDLASTILGAAGIPQPDVMQGRDIADLYLTKNPEWRREFFYEHPVHLDKSIIPASTALVRKDYKLMTWPDFNVEQLFHLGDDPYELNDLIGDPKLADLILSMRERHDVLKQQAL